MPTPRFHEQVTSSSSPICTFLPAFLSSSSARHPDSCTTPMQEVKMFVMGIYNIVEFYKSRSHPRVRYRNIPGQDDIGVNVNGRLLSPPGGGQPQVQPLRASSGTLEPPGNKQSVSPHCRGLSLSLLVHRFSLINIFPIIYVLHFCLGAAAGRAKPMFIRNSLVVCRPRCSLSLI